MSVVEDKAALRASAMAARAETAAAGDAAGAAARLRAALAPYAGRVLSAYMPMRGEVDPLPAMTAHDGPVCVPVIEGRGLPLKFRQWTPASEMVTGPFRALVPAAGDWLVPEVLVVPLLAFDRQGYRLGYGGGFYDRTLERLRAAGPVVAVGYAWAAQEVDRVPIEATDQRLDLVVTEREVIVPA